MVRKDRSSYVNKTYLMIMLPEFYQTHLKSQLNQAEYLLLKILITLLQSIKKVGLETLATALPIPIIFESRRKKIQRFLSFLETLELAIAAYKRRFDIEEMFRDFKSGGYNLEDTKVSGERLISLILLIAIAYTSATIQGQQIKRKGIQKYVGRESRIWAYRKET
jgi:hypothetical protein